MNELYTPGRISILGLSDPRLSLVIDSNSEHRSETEQDTLFKPQYVDYEDQRNSCRPAESGGR